MWCDFDNGPHRTHDRFKVLALSHKLEKDNPNIFYYSMPDPWLDVGNAVDMAALTNRMKEFGIKLLVIDNLGVVIGNVDENSRDMAQIMSALRQLAESTGAAVILIHHRVKGNNNNNGGRSGDTLRGHSSIEASLDLALRVDRVGQSETITIKPTKVRGENLSEFPAIFRAGPDLENQLVFADFAGPVVIDPIYTIVRDAVRSILTDKQHNQKELIKAVVLHLQEIEADAIGENSIRHYIQKMVDENKLVVLKGSKTEKLYSLPTPPSSTKPASEPASGSVPAETAPGGVSAEPASGSVPAEPVAPESLPEKPPSNEPSSRKSRSKKPSSGSTSTEPAPESLPEKPPSNESPQ